MANTFFALLLKEQALGQTAAAETEIHCAALPPKTIKADHTAGHMNNVDDGRHECGKYDKEDKEVSSLESNSASLKDLAFNELLSKESAAVSTSDKSELELCDNGKMPNSFRSNKGYTARKV